MNTQTIPNLDTDFQVNQNQIQEIKDNGCTLIRTLANSEEIAFFRPVINEAAEKYNTEKRKLEERDTYSKAFLQIMNLWQVDEDVKKFVLAKRFAKVAASLLGVKNVRIYHDQALFKEAGGGHTPWHQDQYYWPLDTDKTITMWMPLVDLDKSMGILEFAEKSHQNGKDLAVKISDESEEYFDNLVQEKGFNIFSPESMKAGDATFHTGWNLHKAPANNSKKMREVMTIIYFADGAKVTEPEHENQAKDLKQWLDGKKAGELANSELNPLVL